MYLALTEGDQRLINRDMQQSDRDMKASITKKSKYGLIFYNKTPMYQLIKDIGITWSIHLIKFAYIATQKQPDFTFQLEL